MNLQRASDVNEKISLKMVEDKEFCLSIVNCKNREEVKSFLKSNGIDAGDADIEDLAKNISEVADICRRVDDEELDKIVGGADKKPGSGTETDTTDTVKPFEGNDTSPLFTGFGISFIVLGGLGLMTVIASWIKKKGDEKGWWKKKA